MKYPAPTRADHEAFCTTEGWTERRRATGRRGSHHVNYELALPDGRVLFTRVSHPVDRTDYGRQMWSHILRDQLDVTEAEFWTCVTDGVPPSRNIAEPPVDALPADLVHQLLTAGVPEAEVRSMSKADAVARLVEFWSR